MRIFATSDIHIDFPPNLEWLRSLSETEYTNDLLILGGDISHRSDLIGEAFARLSRCFKQVVFVPGNHDLWVNDKKLKDSYGKWQLVQELALSEGVALGPVELETALVVPLLSWYDYSFGQPDEMLRERWVDFEAVIWPEQEHGSMHSFFHAQNDRQALPATHKPIISFSHFMPRLDLLPQKVRTPDYFLNPVLGSTRLEAQIRALGAQMHLYGHFHVNADQVREGVRYINNAYGYPTETHISHKRLMELDW